MWQSIQLEDEKTDSDWDLLDGYNGPRTPSTISDTENGPNPQQYDCDASDDGSDEEYGVASSATAAPKRKKGGYDSRIEQILYENPELPILIVDAGKSNEAGGKYIVYTIRTGDLEVRRRYSEFATLRDALSRLHPTLIIPPIPEKHTIADYAANPTKAKQDQHTIDLRKRMLAVFLNRCRAMDDVRNDGVWWRFLDPNSSWNEVLHSHPIASIPKSILKAPPLDASNPTPAHSYLPVPAPSARLKGTLSSNTNAQGMPNKPTEYQASPSAAAHTTPGIQIFGRFPPDTQNLSEQELDPYFINFEASSKELETLLTGPIERVNRRTLTHLSNMSADLSELGARYNGFSLSEPSPSLAAAIERVGQAVDSSYIATEELSGSLGASFAEPMRESSQFAGVVRSVLKYRVMKRIQQEMTNDELARKRAALESFETSESQAKRIDQYLSKSGTLNTPRRSNSSARESPTPRRENAQEDTASIDSDFPPTHGDVSTTPSAAQGAPEAQPPVHRKSSSGNFITNKIFGRISHAVHGVVDVDPERTRRDQIGRTRESIAHLEQAQLVSAQDVKDASAGTLKDLKRFQAEKEDDLKRYMLAYARSQIVWAKKNKETWEEAKAEIDKIDES
ncbi:hypothetical protein HYALB_00012488 [Hymenoscyphus albidus]|uniref:PX domain-containing protein n=1 Tax=Hymenoscyphus albidus TaxID=595503 RepID=A0A9N9LPX2_9HELO|nr:hypothetical protein HYALB_00012488 [Hymenoscyphus albidus]